MLILTRKMRESLVKEVLELINTRALNHIIVAKNTCSLAEMALL